MQVQKRERKLERLGWKKKVVIKPESFSMKILASRLASRTPCVKLHRNARAYLKRTVYTCKGCHN
jgi:hypothetical protein